MIQVLHKRDGDVLAAAVKSGVPPGLAAPARPRGQDTVVGRWGVDAAHGPSLGRAQEAKVTMSYRKKGQEHRKDLHVCVIVLK